MGHDVIPIAQHNLPIHSIKEMAAALSSVFDCTVQFGYTIFSYKGDDEQEQATFIEMGKVEKVGTETRILEDETGRTKEEIENHFSQDINVQFYSEGDYDGESSIVVLKHAFRPSPKFDGRWWYFRDVFNGYRLLLDDVNKFRQLVKQEVHKMGGNYCVYIDDMGASSYAYYMPETKHLNEVIEKLQADFGDDFINVSHFMRETPAEAFNPKKNFQAFYDDFADLNLSIA